MTATERALRATVLYLAQRKWTLAEDREWRELTGSDAVSGDIVRKLCEAALKETNKESKA